MRRSTSAFCTKMALSSSSSVARAAAMVGSAAKNIVRASAPSVASASKSLLPSPSPLSSSTACSVAIRFDVSYSRVTSERANSNASHTDTRPSLLRSAPSPVNAATK